MGDAGEGLVDAESRLQERIEEREEERKRRQSQVARDPERERTLQSLHLARTELSRQLETTAHRTRREQITQALGEIDRRIEQLSVPV